MPNSIPTAQRPRGASPLYHVRAPQEDLIGYLETLAAQGDFLRLGLGPIHAYFVNRPDLVREVLVTQAKIFHKPQTVKRVASGLFGENLFTSDGDTWRTLRKVVQPAFHTQRIQAYADTMRGLTNEVASKWKTGETVDLQREMMDLTLGITTKTLFSHDLRNNEAGDAIVRFIDLFNEQITSPLPVPAWLPTPRNREMHSLVEAGQDFLQPIIDKRRAAGSPQETDTGDVLSMLLIAQEQAQQSGDNQDDSGALTDHQVRNEISNLFAAGYEVVGNTLVFTLYLISQHPDVERRLLAELDDVLGQRDITAADVVNLPYLTMVLNESMRLLPVTTAVSRQSVEATTLDEHELPSGSLVIVAPWTLHRRADLFPDPLRFDPERFSPANESQIPKHGYIPFSTGPRICLGNAFAMLQMQINLATILQRWRLSTAPGYAFEPMWRFNTRPKGGMPMVVEGRAGHLQSANEPA